MLRFASPCIARSRAMLARNLEDLRLPNTVILDAYGVKMLSKDPVRPLTVGSVVEINDHEARPTEFDLSSRRKLRSPRRRLREGECQPYIQTAGAAAITRPDNVGALVGCVRNRGHPPFDH